VLVCQPLRLPKLGTMSLDPYAEIQRLVATLPQSLDSVLARSREWNSTGAQDLALDLLRRSRARDSSISLRLELGRLLHRMGRSREGLTEAVGVVKEDSTNIDGLLLLAELLAGVGEGDRAHKMIERARALGAPESRVAKTESACFDADDQTDSTHVVASTFDAEIKPAGFAPPARKTLLGRPSNEDQGRRPLPRISEGGYAALDAYQTAGIANDESMLQIVPDGQSDGAFEELLSKMGLPTNAPAEPIYNQNHEYASPEDHTVGLVVADGLLSPSDQTAAIQLPDLPRNDENRFPSPEVQSTPSPSVHVEAGLEYPSAPADMDDLPSWDAPAEPFFDEDSLRRDHEGAPQIRSTGADEWAVARPGELQLPDQSAEPEVVYSSKRPVHQDIAAQAFPSAPIQAAPERFSEPQEAQPPAQQGFNQSPPAQQGFGQSPPAQQGFGQSPPAQQGFGQLSALPQSNHPTNSAPAVRNRTVVVVIGLAVLILGLVGALGASGASDSSNTQAHMDSALTLQGADTYEGYVKALDELHQAATSSGFLGFSLPGARGPKLRKHAASEEAFVAAVLDYEFGETLTPSVDARIALAPPKEPATIAATILESLRKGDVVQALNLSSQGRKQFPGNPYIEDVDVIAHLAADDIEGATKAVLSMRTIETPTVRQAFLPLLVDSKQGNRKAIPGLRAIIDAHPTHVRARVALAELLHDNEAEDKEAQKILLEALEGDVRDDASGMDAARASISLADVMARTGDRERAEDRYRDALRTLSNRWDLYVPLLEYYLGEARFDEVKDYLDKAAKAGADAPALQVIEARYLLRVSQVESAIQRLLMIPPGTPGRDWWLGIGYLDLQRPVEAAAAFKSAQDQDSTAKAAELAMLYVAGTLKSEEAGYDIKKVVEAHPDSYRALLGQAVYAIAAMKAADSRDVRAAKEKEAVSAVNTALKADGSDERLQFLLCEVYLLERNGSSAEKACLEGRKVNPTFAAGALLMARLRRLQGQYKEAREIIEAGAKQRPEDIRFGLERARIALESHDLDAAQSEINRWLGKDLATFELNLLEGRLAFQRAEYSKAAAYLQNAQSMPQGDGEATVFFGVTLARLERYDEAGPLLLDTLVHPSWSGWGWLYLGELRRRQGRYDDAFENFPKALRDFKAQTGARARFSTLYAEWAMTFAARHGWDHPRVISSLETGRDDGDSDDPELNEVFADYYLKRRSPDSAAAARYLNKVVQVAPYRCTAVKKLLALRGAVDDRRKAELNEILSSNCATP